MHYTVAHGNRHQPKGNAMKKTAEHEMLVDLNNRFDIRKIPSWVIGKNCYSKYADAACITAIQDGTACFVRETEKAVLFSWHNQGLMCCKVSGGEFWVAKSLLK